MSNDVIKISYQPVILTTAGQEPTAPITPGLKPGDAGWNDSTDLLVGQTAYNAVDNIFYIRTLNDGIKPLKDTMYHVHSQGVPSDEWVIVHNLKFQPAIRTVNTAGIHYEGEVEHVDDNSLTVKFNGAFSGKAYLT